MPRTPRRGDVLIEVPQAIVQRIVDQRLEGRAWTHIAEDLDNDGIDTAREASFWQIGSVQSVFRSSRGLAYQMLLKGEVPQLLA